MTPDFVTFRRRLIYVFTGAFLLFATFVALFCILKMPPVIGEACAGIFVVMGLVIVRSVVMINRKFVEGVLKRSKC